MKTAVVLTEKYLRKGACLAHTLRATGPYPGRLVGLWLLSLLLAMTAAAQGTADLQATCTAAESRCRSTGSITVEATGGSGNYNYRAVGSITTPYTSSKTITGLEAGSYTVVVKDVQTNREIQVPGVVVTGSYADPRFTLQATDVSCAGNDGTISVGGTQHGRSPFLYTIIAPSPAGEGDTSNTGTFTNLVPGEYRIQLRDSCGGIQVRTVRVEEYEWWVESATLTLTDCGQGNAAIVLRNNKGDLSNTPAFSSFSYGYIDQHGDTVWSTQSSFALQLGKRRAVRLLAKDTCGTLLARTASVPVSAMPAMNSGVTVNARTCTTFTASASGQVNLTNPEYCVYDTSNAAVACNTTGVFSDLPYGTYIMRVRDLCYDTTIERTISVAPLVPSVHPTVNTSAFGCDTFTATITGQTNLTTPQYCIYDSTGTELACNSNGVFPNLAYGSYRIRITTACGDTLTRMVAAGRPVPILNSVNISNSLCTGFTVRPGSGANLQSAPQYCLYDSAGNLIGCSSNGEFDNLPYGNYCMRAITACGDTTAPRCFTAAAPVPAIANTAQVSNLTCTGFTATVRGQSNLTNPQYCIFNSNGTELECNNTGVFNNLSYGTYSIRVTDSCNGVVLHATVNAAQPQPSLAANVAVSNMACSTFTATINGSNLTSPVYRVYGADSNLVASGTSNVFSGLPYGAYCFVVTDGCTNQELRLCQTVTNNFSFNITTTQYCRLNATNMQVQVQGAGSPYTITVFHPDGSVIRQVSSAAATIPLNDLPVLPAGVAYRVTATNSCGRSIEQQVTPNATVLSRTSSVRGKCPSALSQFGSGDLTVTCSSNFGAVTPTIISRNGAPFTVNYTTNTGSTYVFAALEPGTYVVRYSLQGCTTTEQETVVVPPYAYPTQDRSAIYQCDNNGFSVGASVRNGVGPFLYEIIGSMPDTPTIATGPQASPVFSVDNGTTYALVRLRTVDACGNATLNDVSVLPLQNIAISASNTCYYDSVVLTVDTIPNARYEWYLKQSAGDSTLVGTDAGHTIPFLVPEQTGTYVCKVSVNNGCLTRLAYFNLDGRCSTNVVLASGVAIQLQSEGGSAPRLRWQAKNGSAVRAYVLERKHAATGRFEPITSVKPSPAQGDHWYRYTDRGNTAGVQQYRVRAIVRDGSYVYSNLVQVSTDGLVTNLWPNPAREKVQFTLQASAQDECKVVLYNMGGQRVHQALLRQQGNGVFVYPRPAGLLRGVYVLQCTSLRTGLQHRFKVVFE